MKIFVWRLTQAEIKKSSRVYTQINTNFSWTISDFFYIYCDSAKNKHTRRNEVIFDRFEQNKIDERPIQVICGSIQILPLKLSVRKVHWVTQ